MIGNEFGAYGVTCASDNGSAGTGKGSNDELNESHGENWVE